ncbi:MAG: hypothetical protein Fur005_34100 [Roseiflexaceae bacterium]
MVGIAFGVDPQKQKIGDILVARQLLSYELQRIGTSNGELTMTVRGDRPSASPMLIDRFRSGEIDWFGAAVQFGLVLSGEKLVDNLDFRKQLEQFGPEMIGGEMEGAGLYQAAYAEKVDWVLVKAICDYADGNKGENKDANQQQAATNAAEFVLHVLSLGGFLSNGTDQAGSARAGSSNTTNIHGGVTGPVLSGTFTGPVTIGASSPAQPAAGSASTPSPTQPKAPTLSAADIAQQQSLLDIHRRTLGHYITQQTTLGFHTPPM